MDSIPGKTRRAAGTSTSSAQKTSATNGHLRTRRDHASETAEDYVEAIAMFQDYNGECRLKDLAIHFMVSHVTASKILARLAREGLVEITPYAPVKLKSSGVEMASRAKMRHEWVLKFLVSLGVTQATAQVDAEGIEHHVSDETLLCMKRFIAAKSRS